MELEQARTQTEESDYARKKIEAKYEQLKVKEKSNRETLEEMRIKLRAYETYKPKTQGLGELEELEREEEEVDLKEQLNVLQKEMEELRKQNNRLSISN